MRTILATAATAAAAGIMALGLAAGPAQASTSTQVDRCAAVDIFLTDFDALEVAAAPRGTGRDGLFTKNDLKAAAYGANGASGNLQRAAWALANDLRWLRDLDTAYRGHDQRPDGLISREDLREWRSIHCRR